jgi:hypothetical protein
MIPFTIGCAQCVPWGRGSLCLSAAASRLRSEPKATEAACLVRHWVSLTVCTRARGDAICMFSRSAWLGAELCKKHSDTIAGDP